MGGQRCSDSGFETRLNGGLVGWLDELILTGWIRASSEGRSPYDLTPPLRSAAGIGGTFDLDLLQSFFRATQNRIHNNRHTWGKKKIGSIGSFSFRGVYNTGLIRVKNMKYLILTDLEGGFNRVWVEATEVRFEHFRVLNEDGCSWFHEGV